MADEDFFKDYPLAGNAGDSGEAAVAGDAPIQLGPTDAFGDAGTNGYDDGADSLDGDGSKDGGGFGGGGGGGGGDAASGDGAGDDAGDDAPAECAAVTAWRAEFAQRLESKVAAERDGKAERADAARAALEAMHANWGKRCAAAADANADAEKELLRERDGVIARMSKPGEPPAWGVVPELVDMSGKFKEGARDTSRMRQVLLKLKTY